MRYPASEKLEIIRLVEQSHLPVRRVLEQIGIPRSTFYRWCDLHQTGGPEALDDRSPRPDRVWNRIPDDVRARIVTLALDEPELSPRELAVRFTDAERYFVSSALPTTSKPSAFRHVRLAARGITRSVHRAHTVPAAPITRYQRFKQRDGKVTYAKCTSYSRRWCHRLSGNGSRFTRTLQRRQAEPGRIST